MQRTTFEWNSITTLYCLKNPRRDIGQKFSCCQTLWKKNRVEWTIYEWRRGENPGRNCRFLKYQRSSKGMGERGRLMENTPPRVRLASWRLLFMSRNDHPEVRSAPCRLGLGAVPGFPILYEEDVGSHVILLFLPPGAGHRTGGRRASLLDPARDKLLEFLWLFLRLPEIYLRLFDSVIK